MISVPNESVTNLVCTSYDHVHLVLDHTHFKVIITDWYFNTMAIAAIAIVMAITNIICVIAYSIMNPKYSISTN